MKRYVHKPTLNKIEKAFPFVVEVPKGFKVHAQKVCREQLGRSYYRYAPKWSSHWHSGNRWVIKSRRPWVVEDTAVWQYVDGKLFFKEEKNVALLSMTMLTKPRKGK